MRKSDPVLDLLSKVDLFSGLKPKDVAKIRSFGKEQTFAEGETVVQKGDKGGRFYLVLEGAAEVTVGRRRVRFGPGDYFGEISLLDAEPRTADVVAVEALRVMTLTSYNLRPLIRAHSDLAEAMLRALCRRIRTAEGALAELG